MSRFFLCSLALAVFSAEAEAYTTFQSEATLPTESVNYVSSPGVRGTVDILWSCLSTLFLCTWTILHLNVPEQRHGRDPGWRGDLKWKLKGFVCSLKWMLITLFAPEFVLYFATGQLNGAMKDVKNMKEFAEEDGVPFGLTHAFFANMGGYTVRILPRPSTVEPLPSESTSDPSTLATNSDEAQGEIEASHPPHSKQDGVSSPKLYQGESLVPAEGIIFHLTAYSIHELRSDHRLIHLPNISSDQINDQSKGDSLIRALTIIQVLAMVLQVSVRAARRLPISQLEIAVCAFAALAVAIYLILFFKPKNVATPREITHELSRPLTYDECVALVVAEDRKGVYESDPQQSFPLKSRIRNDNLMETSFKQLLLSVFGATVFGLVHCAAFNLAFPTSGELIAWRVCSLTCVIIPSIWLGAVIVAHFYDDMDDGTLGFVLILPTPIYVCARAFLIVECFRSLCFLPPEAFVATWTRYLPQLGG